MVVGRAPSNTVGRLKPAAEAVTNASAILELLFGPASNRSFAVRFWDGSAERAGGRAAPRLTVLLQRAGALRRMFLPPSELAIGEAYLRGDFDVEGSLEQATELLEVVTARLRSPLTIARVVALLLKLPSDELESPPGDGRHRPATGALIRHSRRRDAQAVRYHYDLGNDFY